MIIASPSPRPQEELSRANGRAHTLAAALKVERAAAELRTSPYWLRLQLRRYGLTINTRDDHRALIKAVEKRAEDAKRARDLQERSRKNDLIDDNGAIKIEAKPPAPRLSRGAQLFVMRGRDQELGGWRHEGPTQNISRRTPDRGDDQERAAANRERLKRGAGWRPGFLSFCALPSNVVFGGEEAIANFKAGTANSQLEDDVWGGTRQWREPRDLIASLTNEGPSGAYRKAKEAALLRAQEAPPAPTEARTRPSKPRPLDHTITRGWHADDGIIRGCRVNLGAPQLQHHCPQVWWANGADVARAPTINDTRQAMGSAPHAAYCEAAQKLFGAFARST
jgi:hypothetical protein